MTKTNKLFSFKDFILTKLQQYRIICLVRDLSVYQTINRSIEKKDFLDLTLRFLNQSIFDLIKCTLKVM